MLWLKAKSTSYPYMYLCILKLTKGQTWRVGGLDLAHRPPFVSCHHNFQYLFGVTDRYYHGELWYLSTVKTKSSSIYTANSVPWYANNRTIKNAVTGVIWYSQVLIFYYQSAMIKHTNLNTVRSNNWVNVMDWAKIRGRAWWQPLALALSWCPSISKHSLV